MGTVWKGWSRGRLLVLTVLASVLLVLPGARAAEDARPVVITVLGDSMADGLWGGLYRVWHTNSRYDLPRLARNGSGLGHTAKFDWIAGTQEILDRYKPDLAVVSIGLNDRTSVIVDKRAIAFGSRGWKQAYAERVGAMMAALSGAGVPTVWMGLPTMRDPDARADARVLNAIFAEQAARHGITFLPLWVIAGSEEQYEAYGPDASGRQRQLRAEDGVHFTALGYDLLASRLRSALTPLIAQAREVRDHNAVAPLATEASAREPAPSATAAPPADAADAPAASDIPSDAAVPQAAIPRAEAQDAPPTPGAPLALDTLKTEAEAPESGLTNHGTTDRGATNHGATDHGATDREEADREEAEEARIQGEDSAPLGDAGFAAASLAGAAAHAAGPSETVPGDEPPPPGATPGSSSGAGH